MTTFIRLVPADKERLYQASLSPKASEEVRRKTPAPIAPNAVEILLDHLFQYDDLWYEDALSLHAAATSAFFAIKHALQKEKLVVLTIPEGSLEEEHVINMLKKRGYWPWY